MRHILLTLAGVAFGTAAQAQDPASFRILDIKTQGRGCNPQTVAIDIASDQRAFTVTFSEFIAELSASTNRREEQQSCRLIFDTEHAEGWEYTIVGVVFRGAAYLDAGVQGDQQVRFGTRGKDAISRMNLMGPYNDNYQHSSQVNPAGRKWSGCKGKGQRHRTKDFTIDANILLRSRMDNVQGLFTVDSVDGEVSQTYQLAWRACQDKRD